MGLLRHGSACMSKAVRPALQRCRESGRLATRRAGAGPATLSKKWRRRATIADGAKKDVLDPWSSRRPWSACRPMARPPAIEGSGRSREADHPLVRDAGRTIPPPGGAPPSNGGAAMAGVGLAWRWRGACRLTTVDGTLRGKPAMAGLTLDGWPAWADLRRRAGRRRRLAASGVRTPDDASTPAFKMPARFGRRRPPDRGRTVRSPPRRRPGHPATEPSTRASLHRQPSPAAFSRPPCDRSRSGVTGSSRWWPATVPATASAFSRPAGGSPASASWQIRRHPPKAQRKASRFMAATTLHAADAVERDRRPLDPLARSPHGRSTRTFSRPGRFPDPGVSPARRARNFPTAPAQSHPPSASPR